MIATARRPKAGRAPDRIRLTGPSATTSSRRVQKSVHIPKGGHRGAPHQHRQLHMGILHISHHLLFVAGLCHRIAILNDGEIVECGAPQQSSGASTALHKKAGQCAPARASKATC